MNGETLLVDQRSASLAATENEIVAWAAGRRVFVSSLITDMPAERKAAREAIEAIGATPVMFEDLGARDVTADQAYLSGVRSSEIYVGMWGTRYGVRMPDGYSATHSEFLEAERHGLRLCLFLNGEASGAMDGPQRDLIQSARNLYTTSSWTDIADLGSRIQRRLSDLAAEEVAPWVRLGRTLFRAREVSSDGRTIRVTASVRNPAVHAEFVNLRDQRAQGLNFAAPQDARRVHVLGLESRSTSTLMFEERLTLAVQDSNSASGFSGSVNQIPAEELNRRAISDGLFGTTTLGEQPRLLGVRPVDPLEPLRSLGLDDSVLRPAAQLLLQEYLLYSGTAALVDFFALGPAHQGVRRLRARWTPVKRYVNTSDPEPVSIDGLVRGL